MKKIFFALVLFCSLLSFQKAGAQRLKFYYYPNSNVYYDVAHKQYIYSNNGNWTPVTTLPGGMNVVRSRRVIVYHNTPEIWMDNPGHIKKYKHYPNGKAVGYKGTNPNKGKGKYKHH